MRRAPEGEPQDGKETDMTLLRRFWTLAKADAHGVLDSLEDSSLVLKQCLREAEFELVQKRQRLEELERWREQLEQARAGLAGRAQELDADIQLALGRDQEDLARFSIRRLLGARRRESALAEQLAGVCEERERLATELESQQREFAELKERVETHLTEQRAREQFAAVAPEDGGPTRVDEDLAIHEQEVEIELLRRCSERSEEVTS
jgi:phage shock protein A